MGFIFNPVINQFSSKIVQNETAFHLFRLWRHVLLFFPHGQLQLKLITEIWSTETHLIIKNKLIQKCSESPQWFINAAVKRYILLIISPNEVIKLSWVLEITFSSSQRSNIYGTETCKVMTRRWWKRNIKAAVSVSST